MDNRQNSTNINWYPGHMAKTKREIQEKLNLIDLVIEVLDARAPISSKIVDVDEIIKEKPRILVMTKYDLCDKKETDKIIEFYQKKGNQVVAVDLMKNHSLTTLFETIEDYRDLDREKRKEKGLKEKPLRILILGIPNVGKSTLINRLVGKKAANVGNRPGVTKNLGWIRIHKNIELLDSPGILWPKLENQEEAQILAVLSSIKEEILDKESLAAFALKKLSLLYKEKVLEKYGILYDDDIVSVFEKIAKKRGCLKKGGIVDEERVASVILQDIRGGSFGPITLDRIEE